MKFFDLKNEIDRLIKQPSDDSLREIETIIKNNYLNSAVKGGRDLFMDHYFYYSLSRDKKDEKDKKEREKILSENEKIEWLNLLNKNGYYHFDSVFHQLNRTQGYCCLNVVFNLMGKEDTEIAVVFRPLIKDYIENLNQNYERVHSYQVLLEFVIRMIPIIMSTTGSDDLDKDKKLYISFIRKLSRINSYDNYLMNKYILPAWMPDMEAGTELIHILFEYKVVGGIIPGNIKVIGYHRSYDLRGFRDNYIDVIKSNYPAEAYVKIEKIIEDILKEVSYHFNTISVRPVSIEDGKQFIYEATYEYDRELVNFASELLIAQDDEALKAKVKDYLSHEKYHFFRRLALFAIDRKYEDLKEIFWNVFQNDNPINMDDVKYEVYEIIKHHHQEMSEVEIKKILGWIEGIHIEWWEEVKDKPDFQKEYLSREKLKWYFILKSAPFYKEEISNKIKDYKKSGNMNEDKITKHHPGVVFEELGDGDSSIPQSPFTKHELLDMIRNDRIDEINNWVQPFLFDSEKNHEGVGGLQSALCQTATDNSNEIIESFENIKKLKENYFREVVAGIRTAVSKGTVIDWKPFIQYLEKTDIDLDNITEEALSNLKAVIDLINEGIANKNKGSNIESERLEKLMNILVRIGLQFKPSEVEKDDEYKPAKSVKEALFNLIMEINLRHIRETKTEDKIKWFGDHKNLFEKKIEEDNLDKDILEYAGRFLPQFLYIDEEWCKENHDNIFHGYSHDLWKTTFMSYLENNRTVYKSAYDYLSEHGDLKKALRSSKLFKDKWQMRTDEPVKALVYHVIIAYMNKWEKIDDPAGNIHVLLQKVKEQNTGHYYISAVVDFFCEIEPLKDENKKLLFLNLWEKIDETMEEFVFDKETKKVYAKSLLWIKHITKDDEKLKSLLIKTIDYTKSENDFKINSYIDHITDLDENQSYDFIFIGRVLLKHLNRNHLGYFSTERIRVLIKELKRNKQTDLVNDIIEALCIKGNYQLLDEYKET